MKSEYIATSPCSFLFLNKEGGGNCSDALAASKLTFVTWASSAITPWSISGTVANVSAFGTLINEPADFNTFLEPQNEFPEDDGTRVGELQTAESVGQTDDGTSKFRPKKPRGRPRHSPIVNQSTGIPPKPYKRSKFGCITCRRRKKRLASRWLRYIGFNCEKNAVICEGYRDQAIWKSGKEKGDESPVWQFTLPNHKLALMIYGVETPADTLFFEHYCFRLSAVLTVEGPRKNAFRDILLPIAIQHIGLMHSILALSSTNINYHEPYGRCLLVKYPHLDESMLQERAAYHQDKAMKEFHLDIERQNEGLARDGRLSVRYGQMLCFVVQIIAEGKATGEHRVHLEAYQNLVRESRPEERPFMEFIDEYFRFHISMDDIISLPQDIPRLGTASGAWNLLTLTQPEAVRLIGVYDGLVFYMSEITSIRNAIRSNIKQALHPVVDCNSLYRAAEIDANIRAWHPSWPKDDSRYLASLLYKQMVWIYLWRTIYPPKTTNWAPDYRITSAVKDGLALLKLFPSRDPCQTLLLAPAFIIGCAAFDPVLRTPIRSSIHTIKEYTNLRNTDRALELLEEVWRYMDKKDEISWDWQNIAHGLGLEFLPT